MTSMEGLRLVAACVVPAMVIPVRHWASSGEQDRHGWLDVVLSPTKLAAIAGVAVGWGAPDWIREGLTPLMMAGFVFLSGWVGLACGSALDLRVSRRLNRTRAASDLGQAICVVGVVSLLVWGTRFMPPAWASFGPFHVLTLAAVCLLGAVLPVRQCQRGAGGGGSGFWEPTLKSSLALLLAAGATALSSVPTVQLQLPFSQALTMEVGGPASQLLWSTLAGAIAGLLMDLVSREDFAPGGLYVQMAAVTLVCSGLAAAMGLSPLWIGTVAGFWCMSATLRRIDLLLILDRGMALPRVAAPALAGWVVGAGCVTTGIDLRSVLLSAVLILLVRPLVQVLATVLERRHFARRGARRPQPIDPQIIEVDEAALVIVGVAGLFLLPGALASLLLGALGAQWTLSVGAQFWRAQTDSPSA